MDTKIKDVVCGMEISKDTPCFTEENQETYYFCSQNCQDKFLENPHTYMHHEEESEDCSSCRPLFIDAPHTHDHTTINAVNTDVMYTLSNAS